MRRSCLLLGIVIALGVSGPLGAQGDRDLVEMARASGTDPFLWNTLRNVWGYTGGTAEYALLAVTQNAAIGNDWGLYIVRLWSQSNPGVVDPTVCRFVSFPNNLSVQKYPHDVAVSGPLILMTAGAGGQAPGKGLLAIPITGDNATCMTLGTTVVANDLPNGKNLAAWDEGTSQTVYVANSYRESPTCNAANLGLFVYRVTNPPAVAATRLGSWRSDTDAFTDDACGPCEFLCAPEAVAVVERGGKRLAFVATLRNGIHVVDVTSPASPATVAHFRYTWSQGDRDADTVPDLCDRNGDTIPDDMDGDTLADDFCPAYTLDVAVSAGGEVLYTSDQFRYGGHIIGWRVQDILDHCSNPASPCPVDDPGVPKLFDYRASGSLPRSTGSLLRRGDFLYAAVFDDGVRILDITEPEVPREIGRFDTLADHPGATGLADGLLGCYDAFPGRSYLLASDHGAYDPNSPAAFSPMNGGLFVLRFTGGPDPPRELRVSKKTSPAEDGSLVLDWGPVPFAEKWNVYRGLVAAFQGVPGHYDHASYGACGFTQRTATLPGEYVPASADPAASAYYLVEAENSRGERGHLGRDSSGATRPAASPDCP